jgi:hypothetical protein
MEANFRRDLEGAIEVKLSSLSSRPWYLRLKHWIAYQLCSLISPIVQHLSRVHRSRCEDNVVHSHDNSLADDAPPTK